jgi:hypothetical protein
MSDDPMGTTDYSDDDDEPEEVGKVSIIEPDSMDYDIFSGDMMES